jgi:ATP-dependent Lhr-like helicase
LELKTEKETLLESVREIDEHLKEGAPLPTQRRVVLEAYDRYLVVHACFGEVVNKTLGGIFDSVLSGREVIAGWWADGYRILLEQPRKLSTVELEEMPQTLFHLSDEEVDDAFQRYLKAKFPFAYKMKFVAERFGILARGKTMSPERQANLRASFADTPVYDETIREGMQEKADLATTKKIMRAVQGGEIDVATIVRTEKPTPLAYHILAQYADISEFMAPERVILSNIDRMKNAIEARTATMVCLKCGQWATQMRVKDLPEEPKCGNCGSRLLALVYPGQNVEKLRTDLQKRREGKELSSEELKELSVARRKADLILSYGRQAVRALLVKGVGPETASRILGKMHPNQDEFYMDLLRAKIQYLRTREFWEDKGKSR